MLTIMKNNNKTLLSVNNKKEKDTKNGLSTSTEVSKQEIYKLQVSIWKCVQKYYSYGDAS